MATESENIPYSGFMTTDDKNTVRSLTNPTKNDFTFHWGGKPYTVKKGKTSQFPEFIALHGAKHLAEQMLYEKGVERPSDTTVEQIIETIVDFEEAPIKEVEEPKKEAPVKMEQVNRPVQGPPAPQDNKDK